MNTLLKKGQRVQASWLQATNGSLAGMQPKVAAVQCNVVGTVKHIRGNHPTHPTSLRIWIQPDDGGDEVVIDPSWITAILPES